MIHGLRHVIDLLLKTAVDIGYWKDGFAQNPFRIF